MKKVLFITGTRADFGKLKSLISILQNNDKVEPYIFATGMHMNARYGYTVDEIVKCKFKNIHTFVNNRESDYPDMILYKTIMGLSDYVNGLKPDLIIVHGDRVESLAGAIVGSLNNIRVAHIEGGEVSGTIDESIRHCITKLAHIHFVSNESARERLIQLGENSRSIFVIGSPDVDVIIGNKLPDIEEVKRHYNIKFQTYAILLFHPVTTELDILSKNTMELCNAIRVSGINYVVIYPNNDPGSHIILSYYQHDLSELSHVRLLPTLRFEYFLSLLKNAQFIIGNSSAGIIEAPYYGIPTINIGTRQRGRGNNANIINSNFNRQHINDSIDMAINLRLSPVKLFGEGNSANLFLGVLSNNVVWSVPIQKHFCKI
jgi:UDP-N-acetylglucosamine 2-epimerase (hydrolysing)